MNDEDDFVKIIENEKTIRKFEKKNNFDSLTNAIKIKDNYDSTKYEIDEKKK